MNKNLLIYQEQATANKINYEQALSQIQLLQSQYDELSLAENINIDVIQQLQKQLKHKTNEQKNEQQLDNEQEIKALSQQLQFENDEKQKLIQALNEKQGSLDNQINSLQQKIKQLQQNNNLNVDINNLTTENQISLTELQQFTIAIENDITLITLLRYVLFSARIDSKTYLSRLANKMKDAVQTVVNKESPIDDRLSSSLLFISLIFKFYCYDFPAQDEQKFVVDYDINFTFTKEDCFGAKARQQILSSYKKIRKINLDMSSTLQTYITQFGEISNAKQLVEIGKQSAECRTIEKTFSKTVK